MAEIPVDRFGRDDWRDGDRDLDGTLPPPALLKRVSWGAIFAGAFAAVAITALLTLLGLGIGLGVIEPTQSGTLEGFPKATLAWWTVTTIIAMCVGGFVAARLAGIPRTLTGALHGLAVWSVASLFMLWLVFSAVGAVVGAASSVVATTTRVTANAIGPQERERMVYEIAANTGITREQAEKVVEGRWQTLGTAPSNQFGTTAQQVRAQAAEISGDVLDVLSMAAWGMFLISLAGLVAAVVGAGLAAPSLPLAAGRRHDEDDAPARPDDGV